jgi:DNA polymerase-3 subunit delta'
VVVLERGLYEPSTIGRRTPETQDLSIDQVRALVLARAAFPPHEGRAKVFIIRRAEELSQAAANALLKTLEEPGPRTHFVLLSATADALLPTIRSRTQRVRFGPLPDEVLSELLAAQGVENAPAIALLSGGSMATALLLSDPDASARRDEFVARATTALAARDLGAALELAEDAKKLGKETAIPQLEALATAFGVEARKAAASGDRSADVAAARHSLVLAALRQLDGNGSVQLVFEAMFIKMRSA